MKNVIVFTKYGNIINYIIKKMKKILILSILIIISNYIDAQENTWKKQRVEYSFGIGAASYLGDLGGSNGRGSNGLSDFDPSATRYSFGFGYRYQLEKNWFVKGNLNYIRLSGDDNLTNEPARSARQLNFRSNVIELSGQLEYMITRQKNGSLDKFRGIRGRNLFKFDVYVFGGIGGIWFDPQGKDKNGDWHRLAPLNTEGQGLPGGPSDYSGYSLVIPYGIGIKKYLGRTSRNSNSGIWSLSLELSMRKTFTDYIDDVSTNYYGTDFIRAENGDLAAFFADPSGRITDHTKFGEPQQRGDKDDNDAYIIGMISLNYKITNRRKNLPKF